MLTAKQFRILLLAYYAFIICSGIVDHATTPVALDSTPQTQQATAQLNTSETIEAIFFGLLGLPMAIVWIAALIGLFLFWRPSRQLFLIAVVFGLILRLVDKSPPSISNLASMLHGFNILFKGIILALIFSPTAGHLFAKTKQSNDSLQPTSPADALHNL